MTKYAIIVPARTGSTRFPCKILLPYYADYNVLNALELIAHRNSDYENKRMYYEVIIAASINDEGKINKHTSLPILYGPEDDVAGRVLFAAKQFNVENIIDITSDCPLIGHDLVSWCIEQYEKSGADYFSNVLPVRKDPDGFDVQIYKTELLEKAYYHPECNREHVGWNIPQIFKDIKIQNNGFHVAVDKCLTLDEPADYFEIQRCIDDVGINASHLDIVNWLDKQDNMGNRDVRRKGV